MSKNSSGFGIAVVSAVALFTLGAAQARADEAQDAALAAAPAVMDEAYFTLQAPEVEVTQEQPSRMMSVSPQDLAIGDLVEPLNQASVVIDQVVNLGKKIWAVVEANRPVVNLQTDIANVLPFGVSSYEHLHGWSTPQSYLYKVTYKNAYGMKVVDFSYRVLFTPGGQYDGRGRFLTHVTVLPAKLSVSWGFTFNMTASIPSVTNAGSAADPVAAAQIQLAWKINTALKHIENTQSYYVRGDGHFVDLSGGNTVK